MSLVTIMEYFTLHRNIVVRNPNKAEFRRPNSDCTKFEYDRNPDCLKLDMAKIPKWWKS